MASKITYDDKISLTTSALPKANKCTDDDLNEIKEVVNANADELSGNTSIIEQMQQQIAKLNGTVLYEDSTGTLGNILLSDNAGNYDYIEIYYKTTTRSGSLKVSEFVNKRLLLNFFVVAPTSIAFLTKAVEISGNQIIKSYECQTINNGSITDTDTIYIYKVLGYK